jgi:hypothetical protein
LLPDVPVLPNVLEKTGNFDDFDGFRWTTDEKSSIILGVGVGVLFFSALASGGAAKKIVPYFLERLI